MAHAHRHLLPTLGLLLAACPQTATMPLADLRPAVPGGGGTLDHPCQGAQFCLTPGETPPCGICRRPEPSELCAADSDCKRLGASYLCAPGRCLCGGETICQPGCTSASDCLADEVCGADARCAGPSCRSGAGCSADQRCGASGTCEREPCTRDDACAGYCVRDRCYPTPGRCHLPVP